MKFRWKLLILLLVISIVPVVSLRTFGIYSVHRMADVLTLQLHTTESSEDAKIPRQIHPLLGSIESHVKKIENYTAGFLIFLVIVAAILALRFSRTVTRSLETLSKAAQKLAKGDFEARVSIKSKDEFGDMARVFNGVGPQLKEHYRIQQSLEVAMQIQKNLLPASPPVIPGLDIQGMTLFSDETGGDYFDYLCVDREGREKLCVAVGDVTGHGIPSALLMATARAFLRIRSRMLGKLEDIMSDINREFAGDVGDSGQFMTLFLTRIDMTNHRMEWVRAGHDPALLYDPGTGSFRSLNGGKGLPLGISKDTEYKESCCDIRSGQVIYIGTDGIWEAHNPQGEMFGKKRLKQVIQKYAVESSRTIILSILDAVRDFRGAAQQEDDYTLVVIKVRE